MIKILPFCAAALLSIPCANAAFIIGPWALGQGSAILTNANTASPTLGNNTPDNADNSSLYSGFATITLTNPGDTIVFSGSCTMSGISTGSSTAGDFRIGVFNNNSSSDTTGWLGYFASNAVSSTSGIIFERGSGNSTQFASGTSSGTGSGTRASTITTAIAFPAVTYDFSLTIERLADSTLQITPLLTNSGVEYMNGTANDLPHAGAYSFNRVGFLAGNNLNADQIQFSNIDVTHAPEPSVALLGLMSAGLLFRRHR